jgi:hypothetical protein
MIPSPKSSIYGRIEHLPHGTATASGLHYADMI